MFLPEVNTSPAASPKKWMVFFDFDNTIAKSDILDNVIEKFSVNEDWKAFENLWVEGKIGSRECLEAQLQTIRVDKKTLSNYLSTLEIDPSFGKLLSLLRKKGIPFMIVSDSFSFIIREILRHQGIPNIKIYANEVRFQKNRLLPSFPHLSPDCSRCAHCKKKHVLKHSDKTTVYVGDGLSDVCPAQHADLVFAKASLLEYFKKNRRPCMEFKNLGDIYDFFTDIKLSFRKYKKTLSPAPTGNPIFNSARALSRERKQAWHC